MGILKALCLFFLFSCIGVCIVGACIVGACLTRCITPLVSLITYTLSTWDYYSHRVSDQVNMYTKTRRTS